LSFELGGKNPAIIFADADFDKAVAGTLRSSFSNCGQVCLCSERVYVERPIFERFVAAMKEGAEKLRYGAPMDEATEMGPLISAQHRDKVLSYYQLARDEGANVVCGGGEPQLDDELSGGSWVEPTIITGLGDEARCVREEIFGPICHISPFDSEDEVIGRANDTEYGLCAAVWTGDLGRGHRMAAALDCGLVWLNSWFLRDLRTPFGGTGASGIGREGGIHSVNFYSELKNVCVKL
jgi:aminomuconate-semialdehyde/2-hydroxymuconate-6-semialdehyde dehydrogenase